MINRHNIIEIYILDTDTFFELLDELLCEDVNMIYNDSIVYYQPKHTNSFIKYILGGN